MMHDRHESIEAFHMKSRKNADVDWNLDIPKFVEIRRKATSLLRRRIDVRKTSI